MVAGVLLCAGAQAEPLGGGQLLGSGRMWVAPAGEQDPRAVRVRLEGRSLPAEALLKRYLPKARSPVPADAINYHPPRPIRP
jgi:hypothetical protein